MKDEQKLMALASVMKKAGIEPYRGARWFYGQTELKVHELKELAKSLDKAQDNIHLLQARIYELLKDKEI